MYETWSTEGGSKVPLIVHYPAFSKEKAIWGPEPFFPNGNGCLCDDCGPSWEQYPARHGK